MVGDDDGREIFPVPAHTHGIIGEPMRLTTNPADKEAQYG